MDYREEIINALVEVCKKARSEGFESAREVYTRQVDSGYKKGLEDAWECIRKFRNLSEKERDKIFDTIWLQDILSHFKPLEVVQKIKEYEERQKKIEKITEYEYKQKKERCKTCKYYEGYSCYDCIKGIKDNFEPKQTDKLKVGDEIIANDHKQVITAIINENLIFTVNQNGQYGSFEIGEIQNVTGRHFPQIAEVLEQLRGEE